MPQISWEWVKQTAWCIWIKTKTKKVWFQRFTQEGTMICNSGTLSLCSLLHLEESCLQPAWRPSPPLSHRNQHPSSMCPADLPAPAPDQKNRVPNLSYLIKHCNILDMVHVNSYNFSTVLEMPTMACSVFVSPPTELPFLVGTELQQLNAWHYNPAESNHGR